MVEHNFWLLSFFCVNSSCIPVGYIHTCFRWPNPHDTADGCEILHQLIDGKHPIINRLSTILLVVQDFATIQMIGKSNKFFYPMPEFRTTAVPTGFAIALSWDVVGAEGGEIDTNQK